MKERIEVDDLTIGMFVAELDRPWLETPFLLQGFLVESQHEIDELRKYCKHVYIEPEQSTGSAYRPPPKERLDSERASAPAPATPAAVVHAPPGSLWDTIRRIFRTAFGGSAPLTTRASPGPPNAADPVPAGEPAAQPVPSRSAIISAMELQYLAPRAGQGAGNPAGVDAGDAGGRSEGWLATVRRWFGSGARVAERAREETAAESEALPPVYPDLVTFEEELPKASQVHEQTRLVVDQVIADVRASRPIEVRRVQEAVLYMVESVVRNANGFMWLARLKARDSTAYDQGLNVAVYLLAFGRELGLPKGLLEILGTAGLLQDIGKLRLPSKLLEKRSPLTDAEHDLLKSHVGHSVEMLEGSPNASPVLIETVAQHHERFDGSGYPKGLKGDEISMLGAMAGIADTYAAMTNARPYRNPALPQEVLQQLYAWRGTKFNSDLVEKFIRCVGIFPVGSLVELNTREVAVVMAHSQVRRLKPRLMLILDHQQQPYSAPIVLDLLNDPRTPSGEPYRIVRGLQADAQSNSLYERVSAAEAQAQFHRA
jgi:HD-GYP domain-containing protein (c-di-GMP phosphodiesterase class II)